MTLLVCSLAAGMFARRAILQFPELEWVALIVILLAVIVVCATQGRMPLLEVP
jgi:hypothetical protein